MAGTKTKRVLRAKVSGRPDAASVHFFPSDRGPIHWFTSAQICCCYFNRFSGLTVSGRMVFTHKALNWLNRELHTISIYSCTSSTSDKPHNTCETLYAQFLQPVASRYVMGVDRHPKTANGILRHRGVEESHWLCRGVGQPPLHIYRGRYQLSLTDSADYVLPRTRTRFGKRGFCYSGPAAWNTLPSDLHDINTDTNTSRKRLKSVLFGRACHNNSLVVFIAAPCKSERELEQTFYSCRRESRRRVWSLF